MTRRLTEKEEPPLRKLALLTAAPALALALLAAPAARASQDIPAVTSYYVVDGNGAGYYMNNPGHNNIVATAQAATYTFTSAGTWDGHNVYLMHINGGSTCLEFSTSSGGAVFDESCVVNANEQWWHNGNQFVNAAATNLYHENSVAYAGSYGYGAKVYIGCCSINNQDSWATPVA